ncbi:DUF4288 domain-containing protein [Luteibacter yeojuensis]|uniref:DUF4288 domain-containing protein n=1 Tax=Luteibacter yeojuensis TaxID=345309 RepID=A0A0F3KRL5_9GAMM|nr:DUF4288 domain-containing protein [Luteibacter yeojuensis]KJV33811.1 hypothetical protein VI08_10640 [Luteibacter yeojuensis]
MWYSAHLIFYFVVESQDSVLVHENVHLIDAVDDDAANEQAVRIGKEGEDLNENGTLFLNEQPAQYRFAGVRKVISVETTPDTAVEKIVSGVEVTYSQFEVDNLSEVMQLAHGDFVDVLYRE